MKAKIYDVLYNKYLEECKLAGLDSSQSRVKALARIMSDFLAEMLSHFATHKLLEDKDCYKEMEVTFGKYRAFANRLGFNVNGLETAMEQIHPHLVAKYRLLKDKYAESTDSIRSN